MIEFENNLQNILYVKMYVEYNFNHLLKYNFELINYFFYLVLMLKMIMLQRENEKSQVLIHQPNFQIVQIQKLKFYLM